MNFVIVLLAFWVLVLAWYHVARLYKRKGHSPIASHLLGLLSGIASFFAIGVLLVWIINPKPQALENNQLAVSPSHYTGSLKPSTTPETLPISIDFDKAEEILTLAYLNHIPLASKPGPVICKHKVINSRNFIICWFPNGFKGGHTGLWEVIEKNGKLSFLAINGKALTALDRFNSPGFAKHPNPLSIDISATIKAFDKK